MSCDLFHNTFRIPTARAVWWDYKTAAPYFVTIYINNHIPLFGKTDNGYMQLNPLGQFAKQCWLEIPQHFPNVSLIIAVIMPNHIHGLLMLNNVSNSDSSNVETLHTTSHNPTSQSLETSTECNNTKSNNEDLIDEDTSLEDIHRNMLYKEMLFDSNSYDWDNDKSINYKKLNIESLTDEMSYNATSLQSEIMIDRASKEFMKSIAPKKGSLASVIRSYKSAVTKYANKNKIPFRWQTRYHDHIVRNADEFQRIYKYIEENPLKWSNDTFYRK
jgi:REP element-mobilizing transposase RayT